MSASIFGILRVLTCIAVLSVVVYHKLVLNRQGAVIWNDRESKDSPDPHTWTLVCASNLSGGICDGTVFRMQRGNVTLFATVRKLPHFNVTEDVFSTKNNMFSLQISSETSV